ncbi:hypothetical protein GIW26_13535 [Pseudomonas syringae]|uniref:hypothetical protein n=1 Tax=Pseudomonas syringae TaxID=317 RepID=UPI001F1D3915|nr:hypothetical protein [Pseudomonas syringae]MCF8984601.1 hypothetical protein [Pseudomonas syringae]MCF9004957.1 hypothetical protein [Pseudomonas syringae]
MNKNLSLTGLIFCILTLSGCDKTSEDHARDAAKYESEADAHLVAGRDDEAEQASLKAKAAHSRAKEAAASEDRHRPPESAVPDWIQATE